MPLFRSKAEQKLIERGLDPARRPPSPASGSGTATTTMRTTGRKSATASSAAAEAEWRRPSERFLLMRRVEVAGVTVLFAAVAGGLVGAASGWWGAAAAGGVLACGVPAEWFVRRRVRAWAYCERADDLLVRRGVLFSRLSVIPYGRMQFVDVRAGPL